MPTSLHTMENISVMQCPLPPAKVETLPLLPETEVQPVCLQSELDSAADDAVEVP